MTSVVVAGAGSIGSLLAAHLAHVADVTVLTRREEHAAVLRERGLRVSGRSDFTARLDATADPAALPADAELAILACKSTDLDPLSERLEGTLPAATVMTIQNGLGAEEIVAAHGAWPLLSAVTFMSGTRHEDTHVDLAPAASADAESSRVREFAGDSRTSRLVEKRTRRPAPTPGELTTLLERFSGSVAQVARHLDRQYAVVWRCIQRYGIDANAYRPAGGPRSD